MSELCEWKERKLSSNSDIAPIPEQLGTPLLVRAALQLSFTQLEFWCHALYGNFSHIFDLVSSRAEAISGQDLVSRPACDPDHRCGFRACMHPWSISPAVSCLFCL